MRGKGNDGKGNVPDRDLWETKKDLFDKLNNRFHFDFDCCANNDNKKCERYTEDFERIISLDQVDWVCWMNPPFSKALEMFTHFFKVVKRGVAIYRCDNMDTLIWQETIFPHVDWIFIPEGRIPYDQPYGVADTKKRNVSRFPSALIGVGLDIPKDIKGRILFLRQEKKEEKSP